ncbi:MAG: hypothetical protein IPF99_23125 [Deltaproteobacteria bacterium]|nr:hypothetical protein [Deltaproteobacteria bacterium]
MAITARDSSTSRPSPPARSIQRASRSDCSATEPSCASAQRSLDSASMEATTAPVTTAGWCLRPCLKRAPSSVSKRLSTPSTRSACDTLHGAGSPALGALP